MKIDPNALEKRIKRHVRAKMQRFYAVVPPGFEATAGRELARYGITATPDEYGGAAFSGSWEDCWKVHHRARIPIRILVRLDHFTALTFEQLERQIDKFPWELWLQPHLPLTVQVSASQAELYHEGAIADRVERGIQQHLSPWQAIASEREAADGAQAIYVRNVENRITVSLDCSGEMLYKRGYDKHVGAAPLRDTLAAAILQEANFTEFDMLIDPLAGSGTFGLEALLALDGRGAGHVRHFAFEQFPAFRPAAYRHFLAHDAAPAQHQARLRHILLRDHAAQALTILRQNVEQLAALGIQTQRVQIEEADVFASAAPSMEGRKLIVCNPPYGVRLKHDSSLRDFYGNLGQRFRQHWPGCSFAIVAPGKQAEQALALPTARKVIFSHGGLRAALLLGRLKP